MIIKKLEVKGKKKESAIVSFDYGLNVIAGASDTGKSYITKCFQFIFGSDQPPKSIEQAKGYTHLEVTFESKNGSEFLLSRELKEKSDITCIELDNNNLTTVLKPSHKGSPNLSSFFLKQFNLDDKILVKGIESMNHSALTLRILEKILLVDEERIISENSPLGKGQHTEKTLETSLLKTLLTGNDDSKILNNKKDKESKESIKQKIENLGEFLNRFFASNQDNKRSLGSLDVALESLETSYERAEKELNDLIESNNVIVKERDYLRSQSDNISRNIANDEALITRFEMLKRKYVSDKERLDANSEAAAYLEQQRNVNCPVCGNKFEDDYDIEITSVIKGNFSEITKIYAHLEDLQSTIDSTKNTLETNKNSLSCLLNKISDIDKLLGKRIGVKLKENRKLLSNLDKARTKFRKERDQEQKRQEIFEEIGRLQLAHDDISDIYQIPDFSKEIELLGKKISTILKRWDFPNGDKTVFDISSRDVVIADKPRSHFGKGYRAICFSAVIIGLMECLSSRGRHPGFIILDSPLTTYRRQDVTEEAMENHEVFLANNMIYAFYRDLCDYYDDKQIIVLDNQEPDEDLHGKMKYIHFSHNESIGRYGFFPVN